MPWRCGGKSLVPRGKLSAGKDKIREEGRSWCLPGTAPSYPDNLFLGRRAVIWRSKPVSCSLSLCHRLHWWPRRQVFMKLTGEKHYSNIFTNIILKFSFPSIMNIQQQAGILAVLCHCVLKCPSLRKICPTPPPPTLLCAVQQPKAAPAAPRSKPHQFRRLLSQHLKQEEERSWFICVGAKLPSISDLWNRK